MNDYSILLHIVRQGPLLRGTKVWDDRELARKALGNRCLSFGAIEEPEPRKPHKPFYHYMNR